jgi:histidine phosphotransfer protein HptB
VNSKILRFTYIPINWTFTLLGPKKGMIDWARILELENEMGKEEMPGLVVVFLDEIENAVGIIEKSQSADEGDLHFLKGCALTFGFSSLATLASDGEAKVKNNPCCSVDTERIIAAYKTERAELLSNCPLTC